MLNKSTIPSQVACPSPNITGFFALSSGFFLGIAVPTSQIKMQQVKAKIMYMSNHEGTTLIKILNDEASRAN